MMQTRLALPLSQCPWCGHGCDRATNPTGDIQAPQAGDLLICIECASVNQLGQDLRLEKIPDAELKAIFSADPILAKHVAKMQKIMREIDRSQLFAKK
jgi:hypothetical protein